MTSGTSGSSAAGSRQLIEVDREKSLLSRSFLGLALTQLLGAANDNILRWVVIGLGKNLVEESQVSWILAIGTAAFVVPYMVLAAPAGYLADRFGKRDVIVACKAAEIAIMALATVAILLQQVWLMLAVVAIMGGQSALFGPAKLGSIPEMLDDSRISAANGIIGLTTVIATTVGSGVGMTLADLVAVQVQERWAVASAVLFAVAIAGYFTSLMIVPLPAADPSRKFPWDAAGQTWRDLCTLGESRAMLRVALGIMFFWSLGALAQLNIDQFAFEGEATKQAQVAPLLVALVAGVGFGSVLAGVWSAGRVELGILPLGAGGLCLMSMLLFTVEGELFKPSGEWTISYIAAAALLFLLGCSAGLFDVPLAAYMQKWSPREHRGSILAASNFLTFGGMLVVSLLFGALRLPLAKGSLEHVTAGIEEDRAARRQELADLWPRVAQQHADRGQGAGTAESSPAGASRNAGAGDQAIADVIRQAILSADGDLDAARALAESAIDAEAAADLKLAAQLWQQMGEELATAKARGGRTPRPSLQSYLRAYPNRQRLIRRLYETTTGLPLLTARQIFLLCGLLTLPVLCYIVLLIPQATLRFLAWLASHTFYRMRIYQQENLPEEGPALLAPNHVSWIDGLLLVAVSPRPVRLIVSGALVRRWWSRGLARIMGAIPIPSSPAQARQAIETARQALRDGELVCMFAEGSVTRSGQLQPFRSSILEILKGTGAAVVPVYLDELWGSIFSFRGGKFFWKWPSEGTRRVSIWFGRRLESPASVFEIRDAVQALGADAVTGRKQRAMVLPRLMIRKCRKALFRWKIADSTGQSLTGGQLLMRSLLLRRMLRREVFAADEKYVGILLPPSCGAVLVNNAVTLAGRVACNLNYTLTSEVMNKCIARAGIRRVLTSRRVLEKLDLKLDAELILLEDLKDRVTAADKMAGALGAYAAPAALLDRLLGLHRMDGDDELTVIFTSGSTGDPKGVVLTHHNVGSNVEAIDQTIHLRREDAILGVVPFFHSLGYTVTLWTVLALDVRAAYHVSPLDAKQVGKLARERETTVLLATPTFLRTYLRRCEPEDFAALELTVAGAEKLSVALCDAFEKKFGVRPVEGYGTTELSPLVSVNVPPSRSQLREVDLKEGTVGRAVPGVAVKVVDPESFAELSLDQPGMLLVKGPNVMKGYLNQPDKTAEVMRDGWYVTGDMARIDKHGFIEITGRLSRFSKIGGEMVPHLQVEQAIADFIQGSEQDELKVVVTSVPDERKGERLVVLHKALEIEPDAICTHLQELGFPNLFIPSPDSFFEVEDIPHLGTGKLDLKRAADLARERVGLHPA